MLIISLGYYEYQQWALTHREREREREREDTTQLTNTHTHTRILHEYTHTESNVERVHFVYKFKKFSFLNEI